MSRTSPSLSERRSVQAVVLRRIEVAAPYLAGILLVLALTKPWAEPGLAPRALVLLAGGDLACVGALLLARAAIKRALIAPKFTDVVTGLVALVFVLDSSLHAAILGKAPEAEAISFVLIMMGSAVFFVSLLWFAAGIVLTTTAWALVTLWTGTSIAIITRVIAIHVATAIAVSFVIYAMQRRTLFRAEQARELADQRAVNAESLARDLRLVNEELEAFSYTASHDLRAPLRSINVHADAALEEADPQLAPAARAHLEAIRAESERLRRLVEDLLRLSRVGADSLHVAHVDVSALAADVATSLTSTRRDGKAPDITIAPGLQADADPSLLRVVLENLVGNAVKYSEPGAKPVIEVGEADTPRGHAFFVRDHGIGFPPREARALFQPFHRLAAGAARSEGTGVGLASVKRIVAKHGGTVWAEGSPGAGATFWFTLPARPTTV